MIPIDSHQHGRVLPSEFVDSDLSHSPQVVGDPKATSQPAAG
jgi:hypothetical protein